MPIRKPFFSEHLQVRVASTVARRVARLAKRAGISHSEFLRRAIEAYCRSEEKAAR